MKAGMRYRKMADGRLGGKAGERILMDAQRMRTCSRGKRGAKSACCVIVDPKEKEKGEGCRTCENEVESRRDR